MIKTAQPLTDSQKLQFIHDLPKDVQREWNDLPREAKREVLAGMDIGTDDRWITGLIEDAKEAK